VGTIIICAIIAAMVGTIGASTITMGLVALPSMLKRGYDKIMVTGAIQAGGSLGALIPPSIIMIVYSVLARISVGQLFAAGFGPGIMLTLFYIIYIGVRCNLQPHLGPTIPVQERASWKEKFISIKWLILPTLLIFMVLGFIVLGVTSITEASAIGAFGAILCAAINRKLTLTAIREALFTTARITAMVMWVGISAIAFSTIYDGLGAVEIIKGVLAGAGFGPYGVLIMIQLSLIILGMFLDDGAIMFITTPVYVPLIESLGFNPVWFGIIFMVNLQTSFLTPPFGYALFYMKGVVTDIFRSGKISQEITMADIYRSVWPFVLMQVAGLVLVIVFPNIAMWLPNLIFGVLG
jgi:tripartite ATP-independent transporter DctM subunit